jgi:2-polyprenyl-6-methoxyphenol hydroxylase-like FAD-dependent oxidoreductase
MSDAVGVAIVGAGPYGLSLAAHLGAAGVRFRQFGLPMRLWQESMPAGMFLKSQGFASDLLQGHRPPLRQLRPASPAGHLRRVRAVVPPGAGG